VTVIVPMDNKRPSYTVIFKLQVVQYAEKHGKRPAGHKSNANEQCVKEQNTQEDRMYYTYTLFFFTNK
jgi:hypothetical protein